MSIVNRLTKKELISPPRFLKNNIHYEVIMGSDAYGVSSGSSDVDVCGFCIPPKDVIFPHLNGEIEGFGTKTNRFQQYQQHHIFDEESKTEYDVTIYNIVKYFQLCMNNNPNLIDSLFVPRRCIIHSTQIGEHVRENRIKFLHKGSWFKFKGYAFSQIHKMNTKEPDPESKRYESILKYGYDVKFAYHVVRLLNEIEQILIEGDLDLERNREQLKSIRRGEWTKDQIINYFESKEKQLEGVYSTSNLPHSPDETKIKNILLECLEMHYGSLSEAIKLNKSEHNNVIDSIIGQLERLKQ